MHLARTGYLCTQSEFVLTHFELCNCSLAELPLQIVMSVPPSMHLWVNSLWFLNLVMSLSCALLATSLQQWARRYLCISYPMYGFGAAPYKSPFFPLIVQLESPLPPKRARSLSLSDLASRSNLAQTTICPLAPPIPVQTSALALVIIRNFPFPKYSTINTFPMSSSLKSFSGNFCTSSPSSLPLARNFKQKAS